ncbi:MAG: phosphatidate cytidylyltransferase, partial [Candidatus Omnitrophica bacterium]|nr:phosphatidate cytidylyltransferase [Candidatus Omnitrophota bacterium]
AGAYFVGKNYGKIKLIEHISPNKSVEGAVGGFLTTVALSLLSFIYLPHVPFVHLLVLGILTGLLAQLGDLAESVMKRDAGVKDSGAVPGLGGILDILDSLILTIPFIYYYITIVLGEMI